MITQQEFNESCKKFCSSDNSIQKESWKFIENSGGYCVKKNHYRTKKIIEEPSQNEDEVELEEMEEELDDSSISNQTNFDNYLEFEYHICYNQSYQVPVLYFNAYSMKDKKLLKHNEILKECLIETENKYSFLTQGNHPILSTVFYYLHPCKTIEFMNEILKDQQEDELKDNYIQIWLSLFGSIIGYYLPLPDKK